MKKLAASDDTHEQVMMQLKDLTKHLLQKNKMRCALNAMPGAMSNAVRNLESFLSPLSATSLPDVTKEKDSENSLQTHFILPFSVNYVGQSILTVPFCHEDYANLLVASKLISRKFLFKEIREKGGAYGGGASLSKGGYFTYYSYRDPNVSKTLDAFNASIDWLGKTNHTSQDIDEAKLTVFSELDAPVTPGSKGVAYFKERITDEMKQELREKIFDCKKDDIVAAAEKYLRNPGQKGTALIGPENELTSGWKRYVE